MRNTETTVELDTKRHLWYNTRMDEPLDTTYDYYDRMSDDDLISEMETAIDVLQMSNQEELSAALQSFVDRYKIVCDDYRFALNELRSKNSHV